MSMTQHSQPPRSVEIWLLTVYLMIFAVVLIGGITRLTGSGLSMVDWHPLMGVVPPLHEGAWQAVFAKYKLSPQYQQVNEWMTLADFKRIFFWEYFHRLIGRLIGVVFAIPWLVFLLRGKLTGRLAGKTAVAFVLGGLQGGLGWLMVKSGLVDIPAVSHFRLAAHLCLALTLASYLLWLWLDLRAQRRPPTVSPSASAQVRGLHGAMWALLALVAVQTVYGAFMAGARAGYLYASFPDMNGEWIPRSMFATGSISKTLVEDPIGIHFTHRLLGWLTALSVLILWVWGRRHSYQPTRRRALNWLLLAVVGQFVLGMLTVMTHVRIWLAVAHQGGGVLLLTAVIYAIHVYRPRTARQEISLDLGHPRRKKGLLARVAP